MLGYQNGSAEAAEELVALVNPILARFLYATSWPGVNLDDMLQECWLRIHKSRSSYRPGEPPLPWLIAIARHTRVDTYRKWQRTGGRETELSEFELPPSNNSAHQGNQNLASGELLRLVSALPDAQREVVVMLKLTGMSIQEVAMATGSTVGAVKQRAYRAYQSMRAKLLRGEESFRSRRSGSQNSRGLDGELSKEPGDEVY